MCSALRSLYCWTGSNWSSILVKEWTIDQLLQSHGKGLLRLPLLPNIANWIHIVPAPRDIPFLGMTDQMGIKADFRWFYPIADHMAAQVGVAEAWGYWGGWWTKEGSRPTSNRPDRPIITPTKYKHALLCISSLCSLLIMFTYQWSVWVPREWWDNFYRIQVWSSPCSL